MSKKRHNENSLESGTTHADPYQSCEHQYPMYSYAHGGSSDMFDKSLQKTKTISMGPQRKELKSSKLESEAK